MTLVSNSYFESSLKIKSEMSLRLFLIVFDINRLIGTPKKKIRTILLGFHFDLISIFVLPFFFAETTVYLIHFVKITQEPLLSVVISSIRRSESDDRRHSLLSVLTLSEQNDAIKPLILCHSITLFRESSKNV